MPAHPPLHRHPLRGRRHRRAALRDGFTSPVPDRGRRRRLRHLVLDARARARAPLRRHSPTPSGRPPAPPLIAADRHLRLRRAAPRRSSSRRSALIILGVVGLNWPAATEPTRHARRLLDAAAAVVRRDGAQALTLDAVAAEAGRLQGRAALPLQVQARAARRAWSSAGWTSSSAEIDAAGRAASSRGYVRAST